MNDRRVPVCRHVHTSLQLTHCSMAATAGACCLLQVVLEVLLSAAAAGRHFHVIVLDSRPELEGRQMLRRLLQVRVGGVVAMWPCGPCFTTAGLLP